MKRYLLFDSGCGRCTKIAKDVETESNGWLEARSLRDQEMQELMKEAKPDWRWQPTLVEIREGDNIAASTGVGLMAKVVTGLGMKRAWRVANLVHSAKSNQTAVHLGRRRFLHGGGALLSMLPLLGIPALRRSLAFDRSGTLTYQTYRDPDFDFTLQYPDGWQTEVKERQPTPLINDEAILKRIVFSSHPGLVYMDIWLARGKSLDEWLAWYKETCLVDQMPTTANAIVAGRVAVTFLKEQQRDLMITYVNDGEYIYRLLNWMTSDLIHLDIYWHMLDTLSLPGEASLTTTEIPLLARREGIRSAERSRGMSLVSNCCGHNDSGNPFPCCDCSDCCCNVQEGNCTWWVYKKMGYVPFTGDTGDWWGEAISYPDWGHYSQPSTSVDSIGCWREDGTYEYGHVVHSSSNYSGGSNVDITDMSWCDHCDESDNIPITDPTLGWLVPLF